MRAVCISDKYCPYKTDTGYCGHSGNWCYLELGDGYNSETVKAPNTPTYRITQLVDISPESINQIADAVVERLREVDK